LTETKHFACQCKREKILAKIVHARTMISIGFSSIAKRKKRYTFALCNL
jgi:hypothetical protein